MNTDRLIDILSVDPEPVNRSSLRNILILAMLIGGAAAFVLMLATVGPRANLQSTSHLEWLAAKLLFAISIIGVGAPLLNRSIRPGLEAKTNWLLIFVPLLAAAVVAIATLLLAEPQTRGAMLRGATTVSSARCLLCVVLFAAIPLVAVILAVRKGAPTGLKLCGGIAGIVAGGVGAAAYAFTCTSDTIPFIAIWYGAAMVLCAVIGALLGPRVLRW